MIGQCRRALGQQDRQPRRPRDQSDQNGGGDTVGNEEIGIAHMIAPLSG